MEDRIRKGNDIGVSWAIFADAENQVPYDLTGRRLTMYLTNRYGTSPISGFKTEGHIVKWTYYGKDQKQLGPYTLTLVENEGNENMHTVDFCKAFVLVARSCEARKGDENKIELVHLDLSSELTIGSGNGGGSSSGGSSGMIDPSLLEGYMPMMREFSDDFNDDFAR
jgi:hypothetical protein